MCSAPSPLPALISAAISSFSFAIPPRFPHHIHSKWGRCNPLLRDRSPSPPPGAAAGHRHPMVQQLDGNRMVPQMDGKSHDRDPARVESTRVQS